MENTVDLDQLASKKPSDQDPHCFLPPLPIYDRLSAQVRNFILHGHVTAFLHGQIKNVHFFQKSVLKEPIFCA